MEILEDDKNKVAIVVVGYNRIVPIKRLLQSLLSADYEGLDVPLVISIDCSGNGDLYRYVTDFKWPFGNKYVNIQRERLGLKRHILQCGDLSQLFRAIILLEDDIFVGPYFYDYTLQALKAYGDNDHIGGISLYMNEMGDYNVPVSYYHDGSDTFLRQRTASWGECWSKSQWAQFRLWLEGFIDEDFAKVDMPEMIKAWTKAWTKYHIAYLIETKKYVVYPYVSHTTCFSDAGEHYERLSMGGQSTLMPEKKEYVFRPFGDMVKYDVYWVNENVYDWLGLGKDEVCVDWYGLSQNHRKCRYLLTPLKLALPIIRSYGLYLRPIELNVKYAIEGKGLFLYDTADGLSYAAAGKNTRDLMDYCIRDLNIRMLRRYVIYDLIWKIKTKILK